MLPAARVQGLHWDRGWGPRTQPHGCAVTARSGWGGLQGAEEDEERRGPEACAERSGKRCLRRRSPTVAVAVAAAAGKGSLMREVGLGFRVALTRRAPDSRLEP